MKTINLLLLLNLLIIGFSCKKEKTDPVEEPPVAIPASPDSVSTSKYFKVDGNFLTLSDTVIKVLGPPIVCRWIGKDSGAFWILYLGFSDSASVSPGTYTITNTSFSLLQPGQVSFILQKSDKTTSMSLGGGYAVSGIVTVIQGNPNTVSFTNILVPISSTNTSGNFTVSANIDF